MNLLSPVLALLRRAVRSEYWIDYRNDVESSGSAGAGEADESPRPSAGDGSADLQKAADGYGPLTLRHYEVTIVDATADAALLIETFRTTPNRFSPTSYALFTPEPGPKGMAVGDDLTIRLIGPWDGPVRVERVSDRSVEFVTRDGHMEAGSIRFEAIDRGPGTIDFTIRSRARAGDPAFDTIYHKLRIAKLIQSDMWAQVLEAAAEVVGGHQEGRIRMRTTVVHDRSVTEPA